jgi:hypothetical protein
MSNPITAGASLSLNAAGVNVSLSQQNISVPQTGSKYSELIFSAPTTSGGTVIPVSSLANVGLCLIQNLDPTNYCDILSGLTGSSGVAFARLLPGDPPFLFRFTPAVTAPAVLAHTAPTLLQILMLEN